VVISDELVGNYKVFVIYHYSKERMNNEIELSWMRNITFKKEI
jgi:hypothetical protein